MNARTEEIAAIFRRWLERFTPPTSIKEKPYAAQDAADSLLRVLLKFSPQEDAGPWVRRALDAVEYEMKTRAWPTVHELGSVCEKQRKSDGASNKVTVIDPFEVAARRIKSGEPVGDMWIYGRLAQELVARGLVLESEIIKYRSGLFFMMKGTYGEDYARTAEAGFIRKHELARA